jgi:hypothetical protein
LSLCLSLLSPNPISLLRMAPRFRPMPSKKSTRAVQSGRRPRYCCLYLRHQRARWTRKKSTLIPNNPPADQNGQHTS